LPFKIRKILSENQAVNLYRLNTLLYGEYLGK